VVEDAGFETEIAAAKGWGWLLEKLVVDGVPRSDAAAAFADPRMPAFAGLSFSVEPREPHSMYGQVLRRGSVAAAQACRDENASAFESAERATGVSAQVVASILHVETRCGRNTGNSIVLYGLARLAMANEPENLAANVDAKARVGGALDPDMAAKVRARGATLEAMFYPEVRATFTVTERLGIGPLDLLGSPSGAFGYPQFLPTSYLRFGTDGDGDGKVDLYSLYDAAASAARFLAENGWQPGLGLVGQRRVIWHYNRSDAYIDAVLGLSERLTPTGESETAIGGGL
jgi:membrane-bound lytic murein transglycosylase B